MKKLSLIIMSLLLAAPIAAKTTLTPSIEIESNEYDNKSDEKQDNVALGLTLKQTLTDRVSLSVQAKTYDYDYFFDDETTSSPKALNQLTVCFTTNILKTDKGTKLDLVLGSRKEDNVIAGSRKIDYRIQPKLSVPLGKDLTATGSWLFYKDKTDKDSGVGIYYYRHELDTGLTYTGIDNYKISVSFYDEMKIALQDGNDYEKHLMQLRAKVAAKVAGVSVTPWARIALGETNVTNSDGSDGNNGEQANRYGVDVSKKINDVNYAAQVLGDRCIFRECRFLAYQDTFYTKGENSRIYVKDCYIEGDVDFIFGASTAVFDRCTIASIHKPGFVCAPSTPISKRYGYLFNKCNLISDLGENTVYLGRPWHPAGDPDAIASVVFKNCQLGKHIKDEGWTEMKGFRAEDARMYEYANEGTGAKEDKMRRQLTVQEESEYSSERMLRGSDNWLFEKNF